jgi:hypothetical protein
MHGVVLLGWCALHAPAWTSPAPRPYRELQIDLVKATSTLTATAMARSWRRGAPAGPLVDTRREPGRAVEHLSARGGVLADDRNVRRRAGNIDIRDEDARSPG